MYTIIRTTQFKKDWKRCVKQGRPMEELKKAITILATKGKLPAEYKAP